MRFCPKCSLKIKGSITQCPICKVELLSCAEEDEMESRQSGDEQQAAPTTKAAIPSPGALPQGESVQRRSDAGPPPVTTVAADAAAAINSKLAQLEGHLKGIGKTLTLHMGKVEVVTRSLIELETKIKKIERCVQDSMPGKAPAVVISHAEHEPDHTSFRETATDAQQPRQAKMNSLTGDSARGITQRATAAQDFPSPDQANHEETSSFFAEPHDAFEAFPGSETPMITEELRMRDGGDGKRSFLIIIPVLCLLALFLILFFYYNSLQKTADKKLTITEQISIPSVPVDALKSQPVATGDAQQPEPTPVLSDKPTPSPASIQAPEAKDEMGAPHPPSISPQEPAALKGFTVAVGAFKQKSNALELTAKLTNKGYPAQMALSKPKKLFRVSVGTFESRKEAAAMAAQIQKKEQLNTAIIDLSKP